VKKSDLTGWKDVFSFTFVQNYKNKASIIVLVLLCIGIIIMGPLLSYFATDGAVSVIENMAESKISKVYIINSTDYDFDSERFLKENPHFNKIVFENYSGTSQSLADSMKNAPKDEMIAEFKYDSAENKYSIILQKFKDSSLSMTDTEVFADCLKESFYTDRAHDIGVAEETMKMLDVSISSEYVSVDEIDGKGKNDGPDPLLMMVVMFYAMFDVIIVLISSQQIATSLVIEKSSKVIESIMVSVKPLALITGKILGTMTVLICNFAAIVVSALISVVLTSILSAKKMAESFTDITTQLSSMGDMPAADMSGEISTNISVTPGTVIFGIFAILVTTLLAFLFYALVAGVAGASCSSIEDLQSANGFTVILTLSGLYIAMFAPMINSSAFTAFALIYPFSGAAMVPVYYITGQTGILSVFLVWAELIVLTVLMAKFAAGIYHALIFHKGERLKLKNLISLSKTGKGGVK